jgi:hypothetical protein
MPLDVPEPWGAFLRDLDRELVKPVELHCLGGYEERLTEMFQGAFRNLRLLALDPYDLALTKLRRNSPRDREDVLHLANAVPLDIATLRARYQVTLAENYSPLK